jgi:hypothetical protein
MADIGNRGPSVGIKTIYMILQTPHTPGNPDHKPTT